MITEVQPAPLSSEEIAKIYEECDESRAMPEWIKDEAGNIIGCQKVSIDAWCD